MSSPGKYGTAVALLALGALSAGRTAAQPGPFLDTVDVNVVNVEVVVTDRDGVPVRGLQAEHFTILEDGNPVELSNFFAVADGRVLPARGAEDEVAPLPTPATRRLRLVVIVDELNIRPENRNRLLGKLRSYLEQRHRAADLMMLVRTGDDVVIEQPFTQDTGRLLEALDRMGRRMNRQVGYALEYRNLARSIEAARLPSPATTTPLVLQAAIFDAGRLANDIRIVAGRRRRNVVDTIDLLERFTRTLAGLPGRKGILYVSDGLPKRTAEFLIQTWRGKFESWLAACGDSRITNRLLMLNPLEFDTSAVLRQLIVEANANQVAFYPISNNSRQPPPSLSAEHQGEESGRGQGPGSLMTTETRSLGADESLLQLAEGTGGVALINSNDIGGLLGRLRVDFDSFYSLGYLAPADEDRSYHRIEVKLADPDLVVRHLRGYRRRDPFLHLQDLALSALRFGLERNPLEVRLEPGEQTPADKNRYTVLVTVKIPFRKLLLIPEQDRHIAELTLVVVAGDEAGGVSQPRRINLPIRIPNEDILDTADGAAVYPLRLEMKAGPQRISVGVRDLLAQVDSTLSLEIQVGAGATVPTPPELSLRDGSQSGPEPVAAAGPR